MSRTWVSEHAESQQSDKLAPDGLNQLFDSDWLSDDELEPTITATHKDTLGDYFRSPLVSVETLRQGGLLTYWETQRKYIPGLPNLPLLSALASSVDAERAFSGGRLTINHLQHATGDTTFGAKMAVGSWYGTPLLPFVDVAAEIIGEKLRH